MDAVCSECMVFKATNSSRSEDATFQETSRFFNRDEADDGSKDFPIHFAVSQNHLGCVEVLLDEVDVVNKCSRVSGRTPIIVAARKGFEKMVELLISKGADVNVKDTLVKNALWYAASEGYTKCVQLLLEAKSDFQFYDKYTKQTPLVAAAWGGHIQCVQALLDHGDQFGLFREGRRENPWFLFGLSICQLSSECICKLLDLMMKHEGALTFDIFLGVVNKNDRGLMKHLLESGVKIKTTKQTNPDYNDALHTAVENSNDVSIEVLLQHKEKLQISVNGSYGLDKRTPLQKACDQDVAEVVKVLLEYGADTEKVGPVLVDPVPRPPIFICLRTLSYTAAGLHSLAALIKHGCDLERKCRVRMRGVEGLVSVNPLEYALCGNNLHAARMLVIGGAQNCDPVTALMRPHKKLVHKELECTKKKKEMFMEEELHGARSLYQLCRTAIRRAIKGPGDAWPKIQQLPLARHVMEFLSYRELDDIAAMFDDKMADLDSGSADSQEASYESSTDMSDHSMFSASSTSSSSSDFFMDDEQDMFPLFYDPFFDY